ncbi:hypothetical protein B0A55_12044 [Friedmanniomyces simplex]|uniref:Uncharacterized protein n=1 Tax=Friedmanniomyces simplex TaxID=329884 RepID=A0A4U0WR42_9PEZI|nr:hypothetical protein B0A55_12044 [Friedmanniomyces simplex]
MRMRKLGRGQTLNFCVPEEIKTKIQICTSKPAHSEISILDILRWAISETFTESQRSMPLWATQGQRFVEHETSGTQSVELFLEDEAQSLEKRYRPRLDRVMEVLEQCCANGANIKPIVDRCKAFKNLDLRSSTLQEEQERELSPEIELERQVQKPDAAEPEKHHLHADVIRFWSSGVIHRRSKAFSPAFETLRDMSAAADFNVSQLSRVVLATSFSEGGARTGTGLRKPSVGGTSGMVAIIVDALVLVSFSAVVILAGRLLLNTYEGFRDASSAVKYCPQLSAGLVFGEQGGVSGTSPP